MEHPDVYIAAHGIGRECCEYWLEYLDQPGTPEDPSEWELSDLDIQTACSDLDAERSDIEASLEAGFAEARAELCEAWDMVRDDLASWASEGLLDGVVARYRAGDRSATECDWHSSTICNDVRAVRSAYSAFLAWKLAQR